MAVRVAPVLFVLTLAIAAVSVSSFTFDDDAAFITADAANDFNQGGKTCNGSVGDCNDEEEEGMMDSESSRRVLAAVKRNYISLAVLKKDRVPCSRRGHSYYNCEERPEANPYKPGCHQFGTCKRR